MFRLIFSLFILTVGIIANASQEFEKIFLERSKCVVSIQYVIEREETRSKKICLGLIMNKDGLIFVNSDCIPGNERLSALKDFKVRVFGGNTDGYSATYLGTEIIYGNHFLKLDSGLKDGMRPISDFKRAQCYVGDSVWGLVMSGEYFDFETAPSFSIISMKGRYPINMCRGNSLVGSNGSPIFNNEGDFIGVALASDENSYMAFIDNERFRITLVDAYNTTAFILLDEVDKMMKLIPKNPNGDSRAWIGIVGMQILKGDVAKFLNLEKKAAFIISDIIKDSPAEKAGLKKGDIIVGMNDKEIERLKNDNSTLGNFRLNLRLAQIGAPLTFSIVRGSGQPQKISVNVEKNPKTYRESDFKYFKRLGFSIREFLLDDSIDRKTFVRDTDAAVVQFVKPNSPASSALPVGLAQGDLILEINSVPIKSYSQAVKEFEKINADKSVKEFVVLAKTFNETKVVRIKLD